MTDSFDIILKTLNEAVVADPIAIQELIDHRVPTNETLANHPTIQVRAELGGPTILEVGMLGVINGLVEAATGKRVAVIYDAADKLSGFTEYDPASWDTKS